MQNEKTKNEEREILHSSFFILHILRYLCATIRIIIALWQNKKRRNKRKEEPELH